MVSRQDIEAGWDVVGDLHGNSDALLRLLSGLGYRREMGSWRAPEGRRLIFSGDLIDRGSGVLQVLRTVRDLEQAGIALTVMGNHEYNFICYNQRFDPDRSPSWAVSRDGWLREHTEKHTQQHQQSILALNSAPDEAKSHLEWLAALPLLVEVEGLRVVHAAWLPQKVERLRQLGWNRAVDGVEMSGVSPDFIHRSWGGWWHPERTEEFELIELLIKGPEAPLPSGWYYEDKLGTKRRRARLRWWLPEGEPLPQSWRELAILPDGLHPPFSREMIEQGLFEHVGYPQDDPPVVVGHYWQKGEADAFWSSQVACVDWSTAKGGPLAAYRWSGEKKLKAEHYFSVPG